MGTIFSKIGDFFYELGRKIFPPKKEKYDENFDVSKVKKKNKIKETLAIWSILIIPLIDLCIFWVYGTIQSIPIAFEHRTESGLVYDLHNFKYLFDEIVRPGSVFLESLVNTLKYFAFSFFVLTPISILMAYFLYKKIKGYKFFRYIFFFPSIVSSVILAAFFKALVDPDGQIPRLIEMLGGTENIMLLADSRYAFKTMLFYQFYFGLCGNLLYWLAAYARIPEELVEAGKLDGLNVFTEFYYITLPIVGPFILTMLMLMLTGILSAGGAALLLTGGSYGTFDLGFYEYYLTAGVGASKANQGIAGAIGLTKGIIVLPLALTINKLINKIPTVEF